MKGASPSRPLRRPGVVVFFTLTDRATVIYVVANPVRGLLDRKRSEEHLQSSNVRAKEKHKHAKNDKEKGTGMTK